MCLFPVYTAGSGGDVIRVGGSSDEHPEGPCSRYVDEKIVPEPQASRRIRQRLPGEAPILTGELVCPESRVGPELQNTCMFVCFEPSLPRWPIICASGGQ